MTASTNWISKHLILVLASFFSLAIGANVGLPVSTTSGLVKGHPAPDRSDVSEYLGIPFALPPTGNRRFAAPVELYSNRTVSGTSYVSITRLNLSKY